MSNAAFLQVRLEKDVNCLSLMIKNDVELSEGARHQGKESIMLSAKCEAYLEEQ